MGEVKRVRMNQLLESDELPVFHEALQRLYWIVAARWENRKSLSTIYFLVEVYGSPLVVPVLRFVPAQNTYPYNPL
jgi:hypothetical protein